MSEIIDFTKVIKEFESGEDLYDFQGNLIKKSDLPDGISEAAKVALKKCIPFDLKIICIRALNAGNIKGQTDGDTKYNRFVLMKKISENPKKVELSPKEQTDIMDVIAIVFPQSSVVGQAWDIIDPKKGIKEK